MRFTDGLGRYMGNGSEFFHNEDESYKDIKCHDVYFSENDKNYIGISLDEYLIDEFIVTLGK